MTDSRVGHDVVFLFAIASFGLFLLFAVGVDAAYCAPLTRQYVTTDYSVSLRFIASTIAWIVALPPLLKMLTGEELVLAAGLSGLALPVTDCLVRALLYGTTAPWIVLWLPPWLKWFPVTAWLVSAVLTLHVVRRSMVHWRRL